MKGSSNICYVRTYQLDSFGLVFLFSPLFFSPTSNVLLVVVVMTVVLLLFKEKFERA